MSEVVRRSEAMELLHRFEEAGALAATHLSLALRPDLNFDQFEAIGVFLGQVHDGSKWWLADWWLEAERRFGEDSAQLAHATGRSERTLLNWVWVARNVPPSRRRESLSFTHHALVAPLEPTEQMEWLDRAERERWSSRELQDAIKDRAALGESDSPSPDRSVDCDAVLDELAAKAREQLAACGYESDVVLEISATRLVVRGPGVEYVVEKGAA